MNWCFFEVIILSLFCENVAEIIAARQNIFSTANSSDIHMNDRF